MQASEFLQISEFQMGVSKNQGPQCRPPKYKGSSYKGTDNKDPPSYGKSHMEFLPVSRLGP